MSTCKTCRGRGKVQDCVPCDRCGGAGVVDSGGVTPWGAPVDLPCPACAGKWDDLAIIGASWRQDSSLEKWFPSTAKELAAYCRMASLDKWRVRRLVDAIDHFLNEAGYGDYADILTTARADAVNAKAKEPPISPGVPLEWGKETPDGVLKQYAMVVAPEDVDRDYCTGFNHGLILAEDFMAEQQEGNKA